jgi:endonuclease YncB( thermonuclease family)
MTGRRPGRLLVTALGGLLAAFAPLPVAAKGPCHAPPGAEPIVVRAALDTGALLLEDGRAVRLADIEVPSPSSATGDDAIASKTHDFLRTRVVGTGIRLRPAPQSSDRYGRLRAYVFVDRPADADLLERSLQQAMVSVGLARVAARIEDAACAADLRAGEAAARKAKVGLWGDARYSVLRADDLAALRRMRGRFVLVEGRVVSVRESGGTVYLNFGRRWSEDFTATVAKRHLRRLATGGFDPKRLERRTVRLRGWVEERGGPWIEITQPEHVEVVGN